MTNRAAPGVAVVLVASGVAAATAPAHADRTIAVEAAATSTAKGKHDRFAPWRAVDGSTETAWCEGKDDEGLDEKLTLTLAEPLLVTRIDLYVGVHGSAKAYQEHNRPSKLFAQTAGKAGDPMVMLAKAVPMVSEHDRLVKLDLKTPRTLQVLELGLAGITRGDDARHNQTCITDVSVVGDGGEIITFAYGMPLDAMKSLPAAVAALRAAVATCDPKALTSVVKFPLAHRVAAEEDSRTVKLKNAKAMVRSCKAGAFPKIPPEVDQAAIAPSGAGRVMLSPDSSTVIRLELGWIKGAWRLVSLESY